MGKVVAFRKKGGLLFKSGLWETFNEMADFWFLFLYRFEVSKKAKQYWYLNEGVY